MSYLSSLEAAGAEVLEFCNFGSYQGDWWAKVIYNDQLGWVHGTYGSCSVCDAFESEFNDAYRLIGKSVGDSYYNDDYEDTILTEEVYNAFQNRLADFGKTYLDIMYTQDEAIKEASEYIEWDSNAQEMVDFITKHAIEA